MERPKLPSVDDGIYFDRFIESIERALQQQPMVQHFQAQCQRGAAMVTVHDLLYMLREAKDLGDAEWRKAYTRENILLAAMHLQEPL